MRAAVRGWADEMATAHPEIVRIGLFGSYARGDWGVGSDIDLVAITSRCELPFERRAAVWDTTRLPVPAELVVYTASEWAALLAESGLVKTISREAIWVFERG